MPIYSESFANHLEFLGYIIETVEKKENKDMQLVLAKHDTRPNLFLLVFDSSKKILFQSRYATGKGHTVKLDSALAAVNRTVELVRFSYEVSEKDGLVSLCIEALYLGDYVKSVFGNFVDMFFRDVDLGLTSSEIQSVVE